MIFLKYEANKTILNNSQYLTRKVTDNFSELILFRVFSNDLFLKKNGIMTIVFLYSHLLYILLAFNTTNKCYMTSEHLLPDLQFTQMVSTMATSFNDLQHAKNKWPTLEIHCKMLSLKALEVFSTPSSTPHLEVLC